jgi:6-phosphogluconolactonase (cycloisomerase 2 family)
LLAAATAGAAGKAHHGYVYTLTNSATGNAVAMFARADDGTLAPAGTVATGGLGTGANLGSQGSIIASGRKLFAVNAGSNTISYFRLRHDGLELQQTIPSGGVQPISLTFHDHLLYVLNAGAGGTITGFAVDHDGLVPLAGSTRPLGAGSSGPAQVSFSPNGRTLVVTEKASSTIDTYAVATHQGAPCWLVTSKNGRYAYTANAAAGSISGFSVGQDGSLSLLDASGVTASLGATSHPLDEAVSNDGRFLYNLTVGLHTISAFRIAADGSLTFVGNAPVPVGAVGLAVQ